MFDKLIQHHIYRGEQLPPLGDGVAYDYIVAGNGVFVRGRCRHWEACFPVAAGTVRGLPLLQSSLRLQQGKIPMSLLTAAIADARTCRDAGGKLCEALYHIVVREGEMMVVRPPQVGTTGRVMSPAGSDPNILLDLHTHGAMPAYFSGTDNADEKGLRLYGVLGKLDSPTPQLALRVGVYGQMYGIPAMALFGGGVESVIEEEAHAKAQRRKGGGFLGGLASLREIDGRRQNGNRTDVADGVAAE